MRRICVVGFCATRLRINGCARCVARRLLASAPPGEPNLSTSPLIGLPCYVAPEKSPIESYLPRPGQRLSPGLGHRVTERDRGHHAAAVRDQPAGAIKPCAGMKDEHPRRHLSQSANLKPRL